MAWVWLVHPIIEPSLFTSYTKACALCPITQHCITSTLHRATLDYISCSKACALCYSIRRALTASQGSNAQGLDWSLCFPTGVCLAWWSCKICKTASQGSNAQLPTPRDLAGPFVSNPTPGDQMSNMRDTQLGNRDGIRWRGDAEQGDFDENPSQKIFDNGFCLICNIYYVFLDYASKVLCESFKSISDCSLSREDERFSGQRDLLSTISQTLMPLNSLTSSAPDHSPRQNCPRTNFFGLCLQAVQSTDHRLICPLEMPQVQVQVHKSKKTFLVSVSMLSSPLTTS